VTPLNGIGSLLSPEMPRCESGEDAQEGPAVKWIGGPVALRRRLDLLNPTSVTERKSIGQWLPALLIRGRSDQDAGWCSHVFGLSARFTGRRCHCHDIKKNPLPTRSSCCAGLGCRRCVNAYREGAGEPPQGQKESPAEAELSKKLAQPRYGGHERVILRTAAQRGLYRIDHLA
jgi:hypothetical protein